MKPSFALNLTEDGITLLHRASRGWVDVGTVAFSDPELTARMADLRATASTLAPEGGGTKLIIPESQILYLQIDASGPDEARRRAQIEAALDGRTPYALDELVYDWSGTGPTVTVAVVARETLAEAEAFATEHGFDPVAFVAAPGRGFDAEPVFGPSTAAHLPDAGAQDAAEAAPSSATPEDTAEDTAEDVGPEDTGPDAAAALVEDMAENPQVEEPAVSVFSEPEVFEPEVSEPVVERPADPEPEHVPSVAAPQAPRPDVAEAGRVPEPAAQAEPEPRAAAQPQADRPAAVTRDTETEPAAFVETLFPTLGTPTPAARAAESPAPVRERAESAPPPLNRAAPRPDAPAVTPPVEDSEAPMAVDVAPEDGDAPEAAEPTRAARPGFRPAMGGAPFDDEDDLPPAPSAAALMAFSARRQAEGTTRPLGGADPAALRADTGTARPAAPPVSRSGTAKPAVERPAAARPVPKFSYDDPVPPPPRLPGDPPTAPAPAAAKAGKGLGKLSTLVTAPSIPGTRKKKPAVSAPSAAAPTLVKPAAAASTLAPMGAMDAASGKSGMAAAVQSLTRPKQASPDAIARGLSARAVSQRGKPKYLGLILTGILLVLLALVAAWSSFYLTRGPDVPSDVEVAAFDPDAEALADGQLPEAGADGLAALAEPDDLPVDVDLSDLAPVAAEETVAAPEPVVAEAEAAATEPAPQTAVQAEAAAAGQPEAVEQDEIFLAGMDTPPALSDPLTLPQPAARGDAPPAAQMPPPPFGTVYQFDAQGRIVPTAEGIMTPDGVMLVAGKPARLPPQRPASVAAAAAAAVAVPAEADATAAAETAPVAPGALTPAETFAADPALSDARPRVRPAGLAPAAAERAEDDASLAPAEDSRFASLRPRLRPQAILAAGEAARQASEAASLAVQAVVAEAAAEEANLSPLAVSVSRVPAARPRDMSRAVEAAVAAATRQAAPQVVAAAAPAPRNAAPQVEADEADDEPEVATAAPRIPSSANVAKQATFVNAINLGRLNLIGVYGTQSKRYALVRQPNGRYRKVQVGDSLDGGRVQAITASEVRYQKGGRLLALAMPAG